MDIYFNQNILYPTAFLKKSARSILLHFDQANSLIIKIEAIRKYDLLIQYPYQDD